MKWTEGQRKAIEKENCNLLVSAAAGSGKTTVLVERIVNFVQNGIDIDRLLVTTFTEAAAKKMKQEIGDEIKNRLLENPKNVHLARQAVLLARADICTIDSFCMKIVRSNFHLLDIDPDFNIADKNESVLLYEQAADEVFEEKYEDGDEAFYKLLECYASQRGDEKLKNVVDTVCTFMRSLPYPEEWTGKCVEAYDIGEVFESKWGSVVRQSSIIRLQECINRVKIALEHAQQHDEMSSYVMPLMEDISNLNNILSIVESQDYDSVKNAINSYFPAAGGRAKNKTPDSVKQPVVYNRKAAADAMKKLSDRFYYASSEQIKQEMLYLKEHMGAILSLAKEIEDRFFEIKKSRSVLEFGDIEHLALKALGEDGTRSRIADELCDKYEMILIDEYQDSNELQEAIFEKIARKDNMFMVGDIKQSIYRFRHTNPLLFRHKKDTYIEDEGINQKVFMSENFRSRHEIIDAVNYIMKLNISPLVGEIVYDESEALHAARDYPDHDENETEVYIIGNENDENDFDDENSVFGAEAEAVCVAKKIIELRRTGYKICDKNGQLRDIKYSDIVVLMRSPGVDAELFKQVLSDYGIPVFSDVDGGYFNTSEVELVLSLLSVIDNPMQDIKLLGVLRSQIGDFCDGELLDMRLCNSESDIYTAMVSCSAEDTPLGRKCADFLKKLGEWRKKALYMPVHELIWYLYNDTGYFNFVGAGDNGDKRRANLKLLIEYAKKYEKTSFKGLFNFVSYAEKIKAASGDVSGAKILGENQDVVRIMSIHKSKGLEFGVVFVSRLGKNFNKRDLSGDVLMHPELGAGVDFIDSNNRYKFDTFVKRAIRQQKETELLSEEIRVLYVALTRAREKLIMTMAPANISAKKKNWLYGAKGVKNGMLPLYYTSRAGGMYDWIMGALCCHESASQITEEYVSCIESNAKFRLFYKYGESIETEETKKDDIYESLGEKYKKIIDQRLGYKYKYESAMKVPTKVSVTELKRLVNSEIDTQQLHLYGDEIQLMPQFMEEADVLDGAQRGTAMHFVMQNLDLKKDLSLDGVKNQIKNMTENNALTLQQAQSIDAAKAAGFFASDIGKRMINSKKVMREMPFEIMIDAKEAGIYEAEGESLLLQGIIDCFFYENDGIVLLDYKTDYVRSAGDIQKIKEKYQRQIELYSKAIEKITGKKVKEKNLYLFSGENVVNY